MVIRKKQYFWLLLTTVTVIAFITVLATKEGTYEPIYKLSQEETPKFEDDSDLNSLIQCGLNQINYLKKQPEDSVISYGPDSYTRNWLIQSTNSLIVKMQETPSNAELNTFLDTHYHIYQAGGRKNQGSRKMLVTGYYEPLFNGSLTKGGLYRYPIYSRPDSLVTIVSANKQNKETGRYDSNNKLLPYWSRAEIDKQNLLHGYELAYLQDPFDAFLLHVQGSGRIRLPDGSVKSVRFAASNGLPYNSIGKLLVDDKHMTLKEVTVPAIRNFLHDHPEQQEKILHHNPRYIFFSWGDNTGPRGSSGEILTPGRSVAMDNSSLPAGALGFLATRRPIFSDAGEITHWIPMQRFVFPQDSGSAIKGGGRLDIFWGPGEYARNAANHMKEDGQLYFFVKKGYQGPVE